MTTPGENGSTGRRPPSADAFWLPMLGTGQEKAATSTVDATLPDRLTLRSIIDRYAPTRLVLMLPLMAW